VVLEVRTLPQHRETLLNKKILRYFACRRKKQDFNCDPFNHNTAIQTHTHPHTRKQTNKQPVAEPLPWSAKTEGSIN